MSHEVKWACPKCGADADGHHGKGGADACDYDHGKLCYGFVCECEEDIPATHGDTADEPCPHANCYHCGWGGTFPQPRIDPKKLKGWAKTAYEAGWRPPAGWEPRR